MTERNKEQAIGKWQTSQNTVLDERRREILTYCKLLLMIGVALQNKTGTDPATITLNQLIPSLAISSALAKSRLCKDPF